MSRLIKVGLLTVLVIFMGEVSWYYAIKPEMEGTACFECTDAEPVKVTIPLGGLEYVDIEIDGTNDTLVRTDNLTVWEYNDARINVTWSHPEGDVWEGEVMHIGNDEVYRKFGDYHISISSPTHTLKISAESLRDAVSYTATVPELPEEKRVYSPIHLAVPSCIEGTYYNEGFRFQKRDDAITDAVARACTIGHSPIQWWYDDGRLFVVQAGSEIVCVKQKDYTSCCYISSNDAHIIGKG